jgi:hypothetical protein
MKRSSVALALLLCTVLSVAFVSVGVAGEQRQTPVKAYEGQVKSIKVDKCGTQPGSCEGSVVLTPKTGNEVTLAIKPGTWIQRAGQLVLIDELAVGNYIRAQAVMLPNARDELAITLEQTKRQGE